ncbi:uncharacterized protein HD556DRAFT_1409574 [Suillus plorans]|uniref:Uncharacterized protein n=1 Tax=Suillus plorans TaxID=116603 RepID=A0A9P7DCI8_9AGAM|nr:uncharacterized protein HD556DRAFT_1409574 [Suillus plorans]KAG1787331.1 hypothetical protein HD556DRAFT_1409574 [Suillus plorans]
MPRPQEYKRALFPCVNIKPPPFASLSLSAFSSALLLFPFRLFILPLCVTGVSIFIRALPLCGTVTVMPSVTDLPVHITHLHTMPVTTVQIIDDIRERVIAQEAANTVLKQENRDLRRELKDFKEEFKVFQEHQEQFTELKKQVDENRNNFLKLERRTLVNAARDKLERWFTLDQLDPSSYKGTTRLDAAAKFVLNHLPPADQSKLSLEAIKTIIDSSEHSFRRLGNEIAHTKVTETAVKDEVLTHRQRGRTISAYEYLTPV